MANTPSTPRGDPAAPFLAFLAAGVVMVVAVLAYLTFEEGRPRRGEILADNLAPRATVAAAPNPEPSPTEPR